MSLKEQETHTDNIWKIILIFSMYTFCILSFITGILCIIFPNSEALSVLLPILVIICMTDIFINILFRTQGTNLIKNELKTAIHEADAANQARNTFFANISHELRTPINIIQGMNEMIIRESDTPIVKECATNSSIAGKSLERLLNNLIIYSRIGTGLFSAMDFQFNLYEFLLRYTETWSTAAKRDGYIFNSYVNPRICRDTIGDNSLLEQLLDNIMSIPLMNSKKITENISFSWEELTEEKGNLTIHVDFPGYYVDDKSLYYLYDDNSSGTISNVQGIDFNFTMIRYILDAVNGSIEVTNTKEKGSDYYITIPYMFKEDKTHIENVSSYQHTVPTFTAPDARILVVDDHKLNLDVITMLLSRTDIQIDTALSGYDALELIQKCHYHIILIDYMMPDMNGIELLNNIRLQYPDTFENTPIFTLSASTNSEIIEKLKKSGFRDFIPKPVVGDVLEHIVKNNLPQELIHINYTTNCKYNFSPEIISELKDLLNRYDISITEGLKYMSGDLIQYYTVTKLIDTNYEKKKSHIARLRDEENYKDLGIAVHALKGNARFVGALSLYNIAMSIELRASRGETDFVDLALPLLYYQWKKSFIGIHKFVEEVEKRELISEDYYIQEQIDESNYLEKLIEYTDNFQHKPAIKLIEQILKHNPNSEIEISLKLAAEYLDELEYDKAMAVFKEMIL